MIDKVQLLKYLKSKDLSVLSTSTITGKTESAVMAISIKDDFTILMNTESNSRKIGNIINNPQVSLIIGGLSNDPSVQIDGLARILDNQESAVARSYMLTIHPELESYFAPNSKFIAVTPQWLRWSDFSKNPPEILEIKDLSSQ